MTGGGRALWCVLVGLCLRTVTAGAVFGAAIAVPVFAAASGSAWGGSGLAVRVTLGMWALPALAAALVWLPQLRFRTVPVPGEGRGVLTMGRFALAWQVMAFMSLQSLSYYATLSWFPTMFRDHGIGAAAAGNLQALMNVGNMVTGLIVPVLAHLLRDQRVLAASAVILIMAGLAGWAFRPNATVVLFLCPLWVGPRGALRPSVVPVTPPAPGAATAPPPFRLAPGA